MTPAYGARKVEPPAAAERRHSARRPGGAIQIEGADARMTRVVRFDGTTRRPRDGNGRDPGGKRPFDHWPCSCPSAGVRPAEVGLCRRLTVPVVALDAGPKADSRPATFRTRLPGGRRWARSPRLQSMRAAPGSGSSAMSEPTIV